MRLVCGPDAFQLAASEDALRVIVYGFPVKEGQASAGKAAREHFLRRRLHAAPRAWDLLSIALSVVAADFAVQRSGSPDGWTREIELDIAVAEPEFWSAQTATLKALLNFLTTDRWTIRFHAGGAIPPPPRAPLHPQENGVVLLSGGLDSLVGDIDLCAGGAKPFAVSQTVRGDAEKQDAFAAALNGGMAHIQLNPVATVPGEPEKSQRARSLIFVAFGVLTATALAKYHEGEDVPLYVCENGFIAINPPLVRNRIGSLSTRTAHPEVLGRMQALLDAAGLHVRITNPYTGATKGEMLVHCADQAALKQFAVTSTSCGRFQHYNYQHCGRCVPCQVRRAAFIRWGAADTTSYKFAPLGKKDDDHACFDDVRSVGIALARISSEGLDAWLGYTLYTPLVKDRAALRDMIGRSMDELRALHTAMGVQ
jgi:7-cyano-7-deazaguanine synthase in queuosine biosynthesis